MIDLVYKTVQTIINKENNGYLSPTEFNILANLVQLEIVRNYFEDNNKDKLKERKGLSNRGYGNLDFNQTQRIDKFATDAILTINENHFILPEDCYMIEDEGITEADYDRVIEQVDINDFNTIKKSSLSESVLFPIYKKKGKKLEVFPSTISEIKIDYLRTPKVPNWTYQVIFNEPLFNPASSSYQDFELGRDEFSNIVIRLVSYFGITIRENEIISIAEAIKDKTTMKDNE